MNVKTRRLNSKTSVSICNTGTIIVKTSNMNL